MKIKAIIMKCTAGALAALMLTFTPLFVHAQLGLGSTQALASGFRHHGHKPHARHGFTHSHKIPRSFGSHGRFHRHRGFDSRHFLRRFHGGRHQSFHPGFHHKRFQHGFGHRRFHHGLHRRGFHGRSFHLRIK